MLPHTKAPVVPVKLCLPANFAGGLAGEIWVGLYSLRAPLSAFLDFAASLRNHCRASRSERTGPSGEA